MGRAQCGKRLLLKNESLNLYHQNLLRAQQNSLYLQSQRSYSELVDGSRGTSKSVQTTYPGLRGSTQQETLSETRWKMRTNILGCLLTSTQLPWHMCTHTHTHEHAHTLYTCIHMNFSRNRMVANVASLDNSLAVTQNI